MHGHGRCRGQRAPRVDEPIEGLAPQEPPQGSYRPDRDDLVGRGIEARRLGVQDGVRELVEPPLVPPRLGRGRSKEIEVVQLRPLPRTLRTRAEPP